MSKVKVYVKLKDTVLDPEGQTICSSLHKLGYKFVKNVRVGKIFEIEMDDNVENINEKIEEFCNKLLVNPIVEEFSYEIVED
ncbi:phosphoribosylformylglycinamidine synthase subunit PurS [Deferribacter autotrophicus]|uniref:Phosphoribosylformylglycinamidine synthase subunit PurS n=1 Tax=Deferribacter autotrophicus TaxID=500465 RepID=A0A5A8F102_9BACT|nr:phosphoribosylformylglycinamidine synthase subunit PurS [Deferribacter autotrophicus]KAA0256930.1 phosphoribosylformylglycinamidine synthase subunit PurS [Deferribacter autotrophicus]